jgi:lysophospholipase L1-like esterase
MIKTMLRAFLAAVAIAVPLPPPIHHIPPASWTVLPLGDSITLGVGGTNDGYRGPLHTLLPKLTFAGSQGTAPLLHEGHSGWRIDQLISVPVGRPAFVLVHAGTNDAVQGHSAATMLADMATLLAGIPSGVRVYVAQIPLSPWATPAQQATEAAFDDGLPGLAGRWVTIVDMRATEIGADGVHPDDAGYAWMAARWAAALPEVMAS